VLTAFGRRRLLNPNRYYRLARRLRHRHPDARLLKDEPVSSTDPTRVVLRPWIR
jgi:hypothetical protein